MASKLQELIDAKKKATEELGEFIWAEMDRIAREMKLESMCFGFSNEYMRDGKKVVSKRIDKLDEAFCDHVNADGFQGLWKYPDGWC